MSNQTILLKAETLIKNCQLILCTVGVPDDQATLISQVIVEADLRGIESHGILRLPAYIRKVLAGTMAPDTKSVVLKERRASLLLDARSGFGQVAATHAMENAMERAEENGVGFVAVRNSGHFGIAAYYAMMALKREMIGVVFANAAPSMAAWGGTIPLLGTNPICVAVPTGTDVDIILDMASSVVARGKIRLALNKGIKIPLDWALDSQGVATSDPVAALDGTLLPIGGPKGYGLALMVDILSGVLTGSNFGRHVSSTLDYDSKISAGFCVQAIDISAFTEMETFFKDIQILISEIKNSPRVTGVERIYLPGEIEWIKYKERLSDGIPVPTTVLSELEKLAEELNVDLDLPT
jgi:LDH2 family malate/lactate/ureidoglycolate dehydrogenase